MDEFESSFEKLLGRQPNDTELQQLYRVRDALGLKNNDALWLILMVLQYYQSQYEVFPQMISQAAKEILLEFKEVAEKTIEASVETAKVDLDSTIAGLVKNASQNTSHRQVWKWVSGCFVLLLFFMSLVGFFVYSIAYKVGVNSGYTEAKDEKLAANWVSTPEGRLAYRFSRSGELQRLAKCKGKGWIVKNGICYPYEIRGEGIYGWRIP